MKKTTIMGITIIAMLLLTACSAGSAAPNSQVTPAANVQPAGDTPVPADPGAAGISNGTAMPDMGPEALSDATKLLIGTFKLEGTDQAVTPAQAATLLPLWRAVQDAQAAGRPANGQPQQAPSAPQDDSATQARVDALSQQIRAAMSTPQLDAIDKMNLTGQDVSAVIQQQGIGAGRPGADSAGALGNGTMTPPQGTPPSGNQPQQPNGMGGPQGGGRQLRGMMPPGLVEALVQYLQNKAAG
jgi:hypothetical protein